MPRSDLTTVAYEAASRAATDIYNGVIESIRERIKTGEVADEETLSDAIFEECDNALIYTADQYACVWGLRDQQDAIEEGFCAPTNFGELLASQAMLNLKCEVEAHDFSEDFAVASDAAEENTDPSAEES